MELGKIITDRFVSWTELWATSEHREHFGNSNSSLHPLLRPRRCPWRVNSTANRDTISRIHCQGWVGQSCSTTLSNRLNFVNVHVVMSDVCWAGWREDTFEDVWRENNNSCGWQNVGGKENLESAALRGRSEKSRSHRCWGQMWARLNWWSCGSTRDDPHGDVPHAARCLQGPSPAENSGWNCRAFFRRIVNSGKWRLKVCEENSDESQLLKRRAEVAK